MPPPRTETSQRRSRRLLQVALSLWGVLALGSLLGPVRPGLEAHYFADAAWAGAPAHQVLDREPSTRQMQQRWRFRAPSPFSVQWSGYLAVSDPGRYTFLVRADDRARLYVDRRLVVDTDIRVNPAGATGALSLDPGSHEIVLQFAQDAGPYSLDWSWARDDAPASPLPRWRLSANAHGPALLLARHSADWLWRTLTVVLLAWGAWTIWRSRVERTDLSGTDIVSDEDAWETPARAALALLFFALIAVVQTWPLASAPGTLSRNDNADTMLNEWTIAWVAHQLPRDPARLFDANIFHPERGTLAYSEAMIPQALLGAPLLWSGASPVLVYNLLLLAGMTLTGWTFSLTVTRWTGDRAAGLVAGILAAFNAHTLTRLPHLQAQHVEFLPLALVALDAGLRRPRPAHAVWLAVWFALQALTSGYLLVFSLVALAAGVLARPEDWIGRRAPRVGLMLAGAGGLAAVALVPFLLPYAQARAGQGLVRSLEEVAFFSASFEDYLTTPSRLWEWAGLSSPGLTGLFPGAAGLCLCAMAIGSGRAVSDRRARMALAFGVAGVFLSFGPAVPGYAVLYETAPLLEGIRAAARFGMLGLLAVAILAGFGVAVVRRRLRGTLRQAFGALAVVAVIAEPLAAPIEYTVFSGIPGVYHRLADLPGAVVAELPFPPPEAMHRNAPFMLYSTAHWRPLLNGYSGFAPASYGRHYVQFESFPDAAAVAALRDAGVTHVVVHTQALDAARAEALEGVVGLDLIDEDGTVRLYAVSPGSSMRSR